MPFRVDMHCPKLTIQSVSFSQSVLHEQLRSAQGKSIPLHEHLWVELLDLQ